MPGNYKRKDHLYQRAKEEGYRGRAAYKLLELQKKFGLIRPRSRVLDLGAWPGGWLQVARKFAGEGGRIVGIDVVEIEDLNDPSIATIVARAEDPQALERARNFVGGAFDIVLSDLSPKLSGVREIDQGASLALAENALSTACQALRTGGDFVCKLFKGAGTEEFVKHAREMFNKVVRKELEATRRTSNEFYLICLGLK